MVDYWSDDGNVVDDHDDGTIGDVHNHDNVDDDHDDVHKNERGNEKKQGQREVFWCSVARKQVSRAGSMHKENLNDYDCDDDDDEDYKNYVDDDQI